jgi:hypothetical protein
VTALPQPILDRLAALVRTRRGDRDAPAPVDALPRDLPEGEVRRVVRGGPFGWLVDARLDRLEGRLALEVLEDSRMAGPDHYRIWEDGSIEPLPNEHTAYALPRDAPPEEIARIEQEFFAHNGRVQDHLRSRGFLR